MAAPKSRSAPKAGPSDVRGPPFSAGIPAEIVRQAALFGAQNGDGWGVGLTILTALGNFMPALPNEEAYLALFHGARRVASDCDGQPPRRERAPLESRPEQATLKRWLRRWTKVRHREAAERTLLTGIASGLSPAALADALLAAETERALSPKSQAKVRDVLRRPCLSDPPDLYSADRMRPPQAG